VHSILKSGNSMTKAGVASLATVYDFNLQTYCPKRKELNDPMIFLQVNHD
jgi:hypothetical protein